MTWRWILAIALSVYVAQAEISWEVPEDGGTPRDPNRIERIEPNEFRVRAAFEDGGQSVLRHAVSRVDLICRNDSTESVQVTLHLDLSDGGKRTDYDNKPEAGMALRDFIFIQRPGGSWEQIDGSTDRWVSTLKFKAQPGSTKVGLSPWYTYADYIRFVSGVSPHPHLEKRLAGKSDEGREQWELIITDPTVSADRKKTIFWHAREHAYETWSSFAMEGLIRFLLSEEAAEFRRHYVIVLHPMTNVDGVAKGFEYRGGYDLPSARGTATGRLTFETIDRLRPDFAVAWHNWIAPRDRNVVFYTDGEDGAATPRAWLRFTQLYPSLRSAGHRWKDEATPLRYNWQGRTPLNEGNAHQYAMKKYGTRVWGWEMPWWNYTVEDARSSGGAFAKAFLTTVTEIDSGSVPKTQERPMVEVARWEMHEFTASGRAHVANPFRDAALVGEFVSPSGKTNVLDGFFDGNDTWRLRFAPTEEGAWSYRLRGEGVEILEHGRLRCTKAVSHGPIRIHPENPYAFAHADGNAYLPMGDTCYGLFDDSPITPELRTDYLKKRRDQSFNFVRMTVGHSEFRAATNSLYWAWGGTPREPDLDRFNPEFFRAFDSLVHELRKHGMNIELILLNFYRKPFTETAKWTPARERQWLCYLLARYGAFDNVFLWTIANEYETHPDGRYRLDFPGDVEWAKATARFIKENDAHRHLVTVHPVISASRRGESPRAPYDPPWRIGEFFGAADGIDVISQQTGQAGDGITWDETLKCWTGDPISVAASIRADRNYGKPVLNSENGYEYLQGEATERNQVHHTDKVRRAAWRIMCAGGYFAAGFHGTIGHSDVWNRIDAPNRYTFTLRDEGAANQLRILHQFFSGLPFWKMKPEGTPDSMTFGAREEAYVIYLYQGGTAHFDLSGENGSFEVSLLNPRTGESKQIETVTAGRAHDFKAPDTNDWAFVAKALKP